jgi:hypothetical protein
MDIPIGSDGEIQIPVSIGITVTSPAETLAESNARIAAQLRETFALPAKYLEPEPELDQFARLVDMLMGLKLSNRILEYSISRSRCVAGYKIDRRGRVSFFSDDGTEVEISRKLRDGPHRSRRLLRTEAKRLASAQVADVDVYVTTIRPVEFVTFTVDVAPYQAGGSNEQQEVE